MKWTPTLRQARRAVVGVIGFTLLVAGAVMILTPGPGWITILLGLSVLAAEFAWARRLRRRIKRHGAELRNRTLRNRSRPKGCRPNT